jgi:hypothetical protein
MGVLDSFLGTTQARGLAVYGDQSHEWVLERIDRLIPVFITEASLQERWRAWAKSVRGIAGRRNGVVHSTWVKRPGELDGCVTEKGA